MSDKKHQLKPLCDYDIRPGPTRILVELLEDPPQSSMLASAPSREAPRYGKIVAVGNKAASKMAELRDSDEDSRVLQTSLVGTVVCISSVIVGVSAIKYRRKDSREEVTLLPIFPEEINAILVEKPTEEVNA